MLRAAAVAAIAARGTVDMATDCMVANAEPAATDPTADCALAASEPATGPPEENPIRYSAHWGMKAAITASGRLFMAGCLLIAICDWYIRNVVCF